MDKSKIFIINTKGEIRYEAKDGEHCTDFIRLEEMCDQFFPNLFSLQRQDAVEDESKDAISCVCYKQETEWRGFSREGRLWSARGCCVRDIVHSFLTRRS